ncbi:MAG: hypothetical protein CMH52_13820 [Myxococcales bacterium]|nr:hypothetical protein [Myxococcales bacterium]
MDERLKAAHAADERHEINEAVTLYSALIDAAPSLLAAYGPLARLLLEKSEFEAAEDLAQTGLNHGDDSELWAVRSQVAQARYQAVDAIRFAQAAIEADIGCGYGWFALSTAFGLAGEEAKAIEAIDDGLNLSPDHPDLLAEAAMDPRFSPSEQVRRLSQLVERFPARRACAVNLALAIANTGDYGAARAKIQDQIDINGNGHTLHGVAAMYAVFSSDLVAAEQAAEEALAIYPSSFYARFALFHVAHQRGDQTEAREQLDGLHGLVAGTSLHANFVSQLVEITEGPQVTYELLAEYAEQWPDSLGLQIALADLMARHGHQGDAMSLIVAAREAWPGRYDLIKCECRLHMEQGDFASAAALFPHLDDDAELALYRLQIQAASAASESEIQALYTAHLAKYPTLDFVWGQLFRYAVEHGDLDEVDRLTSKPFTVPLAVVCAARAYIFSLSEMYAEADRALSTLLSSPDFTEHWIWAWEFALEASLAPPLAHYNSEIRERSGL